MPDGPLGHGREAVEVSSARARARPPRGPMGLIAALAALTVPAALLAIADGEGFLGAVALLTALWAGSLAYLGWTASSVADAKGVEVRWMRRSRRAGWAEVVGVQAGTGGARRGAVLQLADGHTLRWTPWVPFFWFARTAADRSAVELEELMAELGVVPSAGPGSPSDRTGAPGAG